MIKKNEIYNEDCLIGMKKIEDKTVDLICTDLPYGQTARNKWDVVIPFNLLWKQYERIIKDRGAIIWKVTENCGDIILYGKKHSQLDI